MAKDKLPSEIASGKKSKSRAKMNRRARIEGLKAGFNSVTWTGKPRKPKEEKDKK